MISIPPSCNGPQKNYDRPLHVLTITPFYPVKGNDASGCFIAEPLPWLARQGITNTVIAVQPFYRKAVRASESAPPANWRRYFSLPGGSGLASSGRFLFRSILRDVSELHRMRPIHLIHSHAALPSGYAAVLLGRKFRIPAVVSVHGLDAFFNQQVEGRAGRKCKDVCQRTYSAARKVVCISNKVRQEVIRHATADTVVLYNGVDLEMFEPASNAGGEPRILSIGNLIPIKGHELLLRGFAAIQGRYPELLCEIIGEGPEKVRLGQLAETLGIAARVRFLGQKSRGEVAEAVRRCTLFALPSRYEGLGCVYLEAMAAGKPVIACTGQGIEEIIQHRRNGWLIPPEDLSAMSDALFCLLSDSSLREGMGAAARRSVEQYSFANQMTELARLYRECVA